MVLVEENPDIRHITAALKAFAVAGKSIDSLVAAMPADRLDRVGAALTLVPPRGGGPDGRGTVGSASAPGRNYWRRRYASRPNRGVPGRWSGRRGCARSLWPAPARSWLGPPGTTWRRRSGYGPVSPPTPPSPTAKGAELAVAAGPSVPVDELEAVLSEVALIDQALVEDLRVGGGRGGTAPGDGDGHGRDRRGALADLGYAELSAQIENGAAALSEDGAPAPQLAASGADR